MAAVTVRAADLPRELPEVQRLCWDYRDYLAGFSDEMRVLTETFYPADAYAELMAALPVKHARPRGAILLADRDGTAVGCGMIQPLSDADAEIKRVYMSPAARGTGAGRLLSQALIDQARADGYARVLLDTNREFAPARALYEKLGFRNRGPYSELLPGTEKHLVFYEFTF